MTNMDDKLQPYAELWTSGKWIVHRTRHSCAKIIIEFEKERATPRELAVLRRLVDRFRDVSALEVKAAVEGQARLNLDVMRGMEARRLFLQLREAGLHVHLEDASYVSHMPVTKNPSSAMLIEDEELSEKVCAEMIRHGAPVIESEAD
jgi:hypothetical protein